MRRLRGEAGGAFGCRPVFQRGGPGADRAHGFVQRVGEGQASIDEGLAGPVGGGARGHDELEGLAAGQRRVGDLRGCGDDVGRCGHQHERHVLRGIAGKHRHGGGGDVDAFVAREATAEIDRIAGLTIGVKLGEALGGGTGERGKGNAVLGQAV